MKYDMNGIKGLQVCTRSDWYSELFIVPSTLMKPQFQLEHEAAPPGGWRSFAEVNVVFWYL